MNIARSSAARVHRPISQRVAQARRAEAVSESSAGHRGEEPVRIFSKQPSQRYYRGTGNRTSPLYQVLKQFLAFFGSDAAQGARRLHREIVLVGLDSLIGAACSASPIA